MITFDLAGKKRRLGDLEKKVSSPGFWDDQASAQAASAEFGELKTEVEDLERMAERIESAGLILQLLDEEGSDGLLQELDETLAELKGALAEAEESTLFPGEYDHGDAILTIHPGQGGTESNDWAAMLMRMYQRWAERRGFQVTVNDILDGEEAGIKSVTMSIAGKNAYGLLASERGVHRLVRISPFDQAKRRHTSFASVEVLPEIEDDVDVEIDEKDLKIDTYRSQGAGGQHVNKTDSAVRITHLPTGIVAQCQNERSQLSNKQTAMRILRSRLIELELEKKEEELWRLRGEQKEIGFGSQIRSYVLQPYTMVKDVRTNFEVGNAGAVLDGELDGFIREYLVMRAEAFEKGKAPGGAAR